MSNKFAANIARSFMQPHITSLEPPDPLYHVFVDPTTGKSKRSQRPIPPGLTENETKILKKIRSRAHSLDKGFSIFGFRFGWTFLIGFIPVVGDAAEAALSYYLIIRPAKKCNLPALLVQRMYLNQMLATSVGLIPIIGDLIVAIWKVNSRNAALLEDFLRARGEHVIDVSSRSNQVPDSQTQMLVENSKKVSYINGITGDREPIDESNLPSTSWFKFKK